MKGYKYLFLDRDGVINTERPNDYVKTIDEFEFIEGTLDALALLTKNFDRICLITNQRGVGKAIMNQKQLEELHDYMLKAIENRGGHIDSIYFCTDTNDSSINRKPNIGMAYQAVNDFPEICFSQTIMVGNSLGDIEFANKLGILSVLVGDKYNKNHNIFRVVNKNYKNLYTFALAIEGE